MESGPGVMRRYRTDKNISQDALARLVGVSVSAVSQIERGINTPRRDTAQSIDDALGAGGELLVAFGYTDTPTTPSDDVAEVLELARSMREGLTKSQSRDDKLSDIINLCEKISATQSALVCRVLENAARIEALLEHFDLEVDLEPSPSA